MIDPKDVMPGDVVLVRMKMTDVGKNPTASFPGEQARYGLSYDWIARIEPRPLKPGDRVRRKAFPQDVATVVAVHDGAVWVVFDADESSAIEDVADVERDIVQTEPSR